MFDDVNIISIDFHAVVFAILYSVIVIIFIIALLSLIRDSTKSRILYRLLSYPTNIFTPVFHAAAIAFLDLSYIQDKAISVIIKNREVSLIVIVVAAFWTLYIGVPIGVHIITPSNWEKYANILVSGVLSFILAFLLWLYLNRTYFVTLRFRMDAPPPPDKKQVLFPPDLPLWAVAAFSYGIGTEYFITRVSANDILMAAFYLTQLWLLGVILYFAVNGGKKIKMQSIREIRYLNELKTYARGGMIKLPKTIREGSSNNIRAAIAPADDMNGYFEFELQAAGLAVDGGKVQRRWVSGTLNYLWNCSFPTAGDHKLNLILRAVDQSDLEHEHENLITHELKVTSLASRSWPPLLTSFFGAANIVIVLLYYLNIIHH